MSPRRTLGLFCWACVLVSSLLLLFLSATRTHAAPQGTSYKVVRRMPVGGDGGWDYILVDPDGHRIYISRGDHMMVVDEVSGKVVAEQPRHVMLRESINHLAHHRGQLTVYLRLNDVPVPAIYGPSADDQRFG